MAFAAKISKFNVGELLYAEPLFEGVRGSLIECSAGTSGGDPQTFGGFIGQSKANNL